MAAPECPRHDVPMELLPSEPVARCPNCGYRSYHVQFEHCPQCRRKLEIEAPEPRWHCPLCASARGRSSAMSFALTSPAFSHEGTIPRQCTCDGEDRSPALRWTGVPAGTRSFALILHDPDAPRGDFTHWVLFDIPVGVQEIQEGTAGPAPGVAGTNDFGKQGYSGPCPPPGHGRHRYFFTLYALDVERAGLNRGARRAEVEAAIRAHILDQTQLIGTYQRG
jgi:Raf kinase inhibitor-like YbhB/YbcL family protein